MYPGQLLGDPALPAPLISSPKGLSGLKSKRERLGNKRRGSTREDGRGWQEEHPHLPVLPGKSKSRSSSRNVFAAHQPSLHRSHRTYSLLHVFPSAIYWHLFPLTFSNPSPGKEQSPHRQQLENCGSDGKANSTQETIPALSAAFAQGWLGFHS